MAREISEEQFDELAKAASDEGCLKGCETEHGEQFGVFLNGHLVATKTPTEDGEYTCELLLD